MKTKKKHNYSKILERIQIRITKLEDELRSRSAVENYTRCVQIQAELWTLHRLHTEFGLMQWEK